MLISGGVARGSDARWGAQLEWVKEAVRSGEEIAPVNDVRHGVGVEEKDIP